MRHRVSTGQGIAEFDRKSSALPAHKRFPLTLIFTLLLVILPAVPAQGQTVTATVGVGGQPQAVAVNPVTNKVYVVNESSNNITVIDGASNAATTVTAGINPYAVAVNPVTNKIYVANHGDPPSCSLACRKGGSGGRVRVPANFYLSARCARCDLNLQENDEDHKSTGNSLTYASRSHLGGLKLIFFVL